MLHNLAEHAEALLYVRDIGAESTWTFVQKRPACVEHYERHAAEAGIKDIVERTRGWIDRLGEGGKVRALRRHTDHWDYTFDVSRHRLHLSRDMWGFVVASIAGVVAIGRRGDTLRRVRISPGGVSMGTVPRGPHRSPAPVPWYRRAARSFGPVLHKVLGAPPEMRAPFKLPHDPELPRSAPVNKRAVWSFALGLVGLPLVYPLWPISLVALLLGISGYRRIKGSGGQERGLWLTIGGIALGALGMVALGYLTWDFVRHGA